MSKAEICTPISSEIGQKSQAWRIVSAKGPGPDDQPLAAEPHGSRDGIEHLYERHTWVEPLLSRVPLVQAFAALTALNISFALLALFSGAVSNGPVFYQAGLISIIVAVILGSALFAFRLRTTLQRQRQALETARRRIQVASVEKQALSVGNSRLNSDLLSKIAQLKDAQEEMLRKGRLAQLGQLTATVAHEIRNPLGVIRTATFLIERKVKAQELGIDTQLKRVATAITRCDKIIAELLDFTRSRDLEFRSFPVDSWVKATVEEQLEQLPHILTVTYDLGLGETEASFDEDRMRRVLINLLSNASEAMIGKAEDLISSPTAEPHLLVATRLVGNRIEFSVTDNGPGISSDNQQKILEPLFTTKSFGIGLGLPAVQKILQQHGGGLNFESTLGEGATFKAWFPQVQVNRSAA